MLQVGNYIAVGRTMNIGGNDTVLKGTHQEKTCLLRGLNTVTTMLQQMKTE